jgi:hypothetical protein
MHASDTVPEKYKSVAKRVDPSRSQIPAAQQAEAQRQAAILKANAASAAPAPVGSVAQTGGTRRAARGASAPARPSAPHGASDLRRAETDSSASQIPTGPVATTPAPTRWCRPRAGGPAGH